MQKPRTMCWEIIQRKELTYIGDGTILEDGYAHFVPAPRGVIHPINEIWTTCVDVIGVKVSNMGRFKDANGDFIKAQKESSEKRYPKIWIQDKKHAVHRLVFYSFFRHCDRNDRQYVVDHINGNSHDYRLVNLQYVTQSYNISKGSEDHSGASW
jgi:hypothetical protein